MEYGNELFLQLQDKAFVNIEFHLARLVSVFKSCCS